MEFLRKRQHDVEGRAMIRQALDPNASLHGLGQPSAEVESQAVAIRFPGVAPIESVEFLKDALALPRWDTRPGIADGEYPFAIFSMQADADFTFFWGIFDGIIDQVRDNLMQAVR